MCSFELSRYRRANIWLDEAPPAAFTATSVITHVVKPTRVLEPARRLAGIEIGVPRGPMSSYGLLGAELVEAAQDGLEVEVSLNKLGFPFGQSLALSSDDVRVGLLDEYASAVFAGVARVAESSGAPTRASLRFRWAAHGLVGSSPSIFQEISGLVLRAFTLPKNVSDEDIRELFG